MSLGSPRVARLTLEEEVLAEADDLFQSCESYITQAKSSFSVLPFAAINEWRTKRKDEHLSQMYDSLLPRIQASEKALRAILEKTAEGKESVRKEARDLQLHLTNCIEGFRDDLSESEPVVDQLRDVVDLVASQSSSVKFMLQFNDEVARQKMSENALKERQALAPWSIRMPNAAAALGNIDAYDVSADADHINLSGKLQTLRNTREQAMSTLAVVLEQKEARTQSLSGCCSSKDAIEGILRRDVRSTSFPSPTGSSNSGSDAASPFSPASGATDDKRAAVEAILTASDKCVEKFEQIQKTSVESTKRLQRLVEIRERINEVDSSLLSGAGNE